MQNSQLLATVTPRSAGPASLQSFAVTVRRLTNSAISLGVSRDVDDFLKSHDDLELVLSLPDQSQTCTIACIVRSRGELGESWIYGCEYDWSATMDPLGAVEDLLEYMIDAD